MYSRIPHYFLKSTAFFFFSIWVLHSLTPRAEIRNPATDWFQRARFGVFIHLLPDNSREFELVKVFDVQHLADQLETAGAGYVVLTLGQNSGFMSAPNRTYERITGYSTGERCSTRDLPMDLFRALNPKGIKLMLYLPCQAPNRDPKAQKAFGLPQGADDQPIDLEFARQWAEVIGEWSARYGDKIAGWWFDGGYKWVGFNEEIARIYAEAVKRSNPGAIVTFNPGVSLIRWMEAEDYTAGELRDPFEQIPHGRWLEGSQWHALTFLGSRWGARDTRFESERWADWVAEVAAHGGVVTLDAGPNLDPDRGPVGSLSAAQVAQLKKVREAVESVKARHR